MRTSELAGQVGVNPETLRYYERRGLLEKPPRTPGGYRDYPVSALELLRFVKRAQELGFSLDEIEELLHLDTGGPDSCDAARALATSRKTDLETRIADLERMRDSLQQLIVTCDLPRADRHCPLLEAISGPIPTRSDTMPAELDSSLDLKPVSSSEPAAPGDVLSAWRKRAVPLESVEKAVDQAVLRAFAATGRAPKPAELDPVLDEVAAGTGRSTSEVLNALHDLDAIRLGADGRIAVAYPFSAAPTRHRVLLGEVGQPGDELVEVFAMCAIDALGIPAMLGTSARIESVDVTTSAPIMVTMPPPGGQATWEPAGAVVFVGATADGPSADCCCDYLNFFTDHAAAKAWTVAHPDVPGQILDQAGAEQLGTDLFGPLLET